MARAFRHTTLADRAATTTANRRDPLVGGTGVDNRGVLEVVHKPALGEARAAARAVDADDCRTLLAMLGLEETR